MAGNKLLVATVVLATLLAVVVWQFNARDIEDRRGPDVSVKLPKLKKDDVDELSIAVPEKQPVVMKKVDKKWTIVEPLKTAAEASAVDTALSKLEELEVVGVAATKPENHEKLEITDKKAVHVIAKKEGKPLADLLIGAYRTGNTMVREPSAANVATVKGSIRYAFDKELKDWRDRLIVEATADQVTAIAFENAQGSFHFVKEGSEWKQAPGDKPLPNYDGSKLISLVGTASSLRANDFAAADVTPEAAGVGEKPQGTVTLTAGGDAGPQQIVLHPGHKHGDGYYLTREGKDAIYVVSDFSGGRMLSGPDKFVKDEPKAADNKGKTPAVAEAGKVIPVHPVHPGH